jgi:hypothetical protein
MTKFRGEHDQQTLAGCQDKSFLQNLLNEDPPPQECQVETQPETLRDTHSTLPALDWLREASLKKTGYGFNANCDPMLTGQVINLPDGNRQFIYRTPQAFRGCDDAMLDLFCDMIVKDESGKAHRVPIIWGSQEKAVAAVLQENVRKDNSIVTDRIKLPMLAIHSAGHDFDPDRYTYHKAKSYLRELREDMKPAFTKDEVYERDTIFGVSRGIPVNITYTLYVWTLYWEDMNQIVQQVELKCNPLAYINVRGVYWESVAQIDSRANNLDTEPGDKLRVLKYQFNLTAKTYIPQPIERMKAVLKMRVGMNEGTDKEVSSVLSELTEAVEELRDD